MPPACIHGAKIRGGGTKEADTEEMEATGGGKSSDHTWRPTLTLNVRTRTKDHTRPCTLPVRSGSVESSISTSVRREKRFAEKEEAKAVEEVENQEAPAKSQEAPAVEDSTMAVSLSGED